MAISPVYPVILQNGTLADANQVMADFFQIQNDVNANAAHNGANSDITSLLGLTTPLPISEGGTGAATAAQALINLGVTAALAAIITVPIGGTIIWNSSTLPVGGKFLEENGQALSRTTYSVLFSIIGTTYGAGDGSTTFNLPDSRGYFDRGWAGTGSIDAGRAFGSTQADTVGPHNHPITDPQHIHSFVAVTGPFGPSDGVAGGSGVGPQSSTTAAASTGITVDNNTGTTETRPINIARMKIIRVL